MEVINITEEQRNKLCSELARLTFEFRKDKSVKCVYFAPYKGLGSITGNVLEVTLVRDGREDDVLDEKLKEYNLVHQEHDFIRKFGFKILLDTDALSEYTTMDLKTSGFERSNNLMNSVILYDETGEFTQIKTKAANSVKDNAEGMTGAYCYYDNLAEVFPPLDEALDRAMDVACMERDTKAVKEFTKSSLFQHIINM